MIFDSLKLEIDKKQFCPDLKDLENEEVKELAKRLVRISEKETLANLLEWQTRNIVFWTDRMYFSVILYILLSVSMYFLPTNEVVKFILIILLFSMFLINYIVMLSYGITLLSIIYVTILWLFFVNPLQASKFYPITNLVALSSIFGAFIALVGYLVLKYSTLKSRLPDFKVGDTFSTSLQIDKILKYRLAICRDYAKLTAVLLYNLFPNNPIYFISIPRHVAAGIEINGKLYVLDQKLPVMTLDGWLRVWKRKTATVYQMKILEFDGKRKLKLEKRGVAKLTNLSARMNAERMTSEVAKLIKIAQVTHGNEAIVKTSLLLKLAECYEDDEIVIYSIARAIKLALENELCMNVDKISKVEVIQDGADLVVKVYLET